MTSTRTRLGLRVTGVVQGVGFRPFVHRLATELALVGHVGNDAAGVFIEVEGDATAVDRFTTRLRDEAPPLARITDLKVTSLPAQGRSAGNAAGPADAPPGNAAGPADAPAADGHPGPDRGFTIVASPQGGAVTTLVPADVGICAACRRELFDPGDRRHRHPFITCTDCGPRFTITRRLPYDRPGTTMAGFPMCPPCTREYHDPTDRRFHAQPIACPDCGPTLRFEPARARNTTGVHVGVARTRAAAVSPAGPAADGVLHGTEPALLAARRILSRGGTVAVKGIGGYHLACDATSAAAVARLRRRKARPDKPFAVMVADVEVARSVAIFDEVELDALCSPQRPVVLARRRTGPRVGPAVVDDVAPGNPWLGVMLPSSPLHELLLAPGHDPAHDPAHDPGHDRADDPADAVPTVLVMTSGNVAGEPISFADADATARLTPLVDGFLTHDRPIHVPCDDGVVRVIDGEVVPIRRSRGDAPLPLALPSDAPATLAVGAELKNTVGVGVGRQAWLSQHIGDLGALETLQAFEHAVAQLTSFFHVEPTHVAVDPHPAYTTHAWARRHHRERLHQVQHHHAHAAALLAEHGLPPDEQALVATFDGTGYGEDQTVWGGELLLADQRRSQRVAHLSTVPLPGGDSAVTNPAHMALAALWAVGVEWHEDLACVRALTGGQRRLLRQQLERDVACVPTSSAGRLFDAVSALLGVRQCISYEGQAAIELEWLADAFSRRGDADDDAPGYHLALRAAHTDGGPLRLDAAPLLQEVVSDVLAGVDRTAIAAGFHLAVAHAVREVADGVSATGGPRTVGLTGGVFQNAWLTTRTRAALEGEGYRVLTHRLVPPNDGGLAYGQLAVVAARYGATAPVPDHGPRTANGATPGSGAPPTT